MNERTCSAYDEGRPCAGTATMTTPVTLCRTHQIEVALAVVPQLLRDQMSVSQTEPGTPAPRMDLVSSATAVSVETLPEAPHEHIVYFIANGGRVKIGYTANLRVRLASLSLRPDNVLLALAGGPELERALHTHFAAYRNGSTEWFELSPEIFRYVAGAAGRPQALVRPAGVEPWDLAERDRKAAEIVSDDPGISGAELARQLGVNTRTGQRVLARIKGEAVAE